MAGAYSGPLDRESDALPTAPHKQLLTMLHFSEYVLLLACVFKRVYVIHLYDTCTQRCHYQWLLVSHTVNSPARDLLWVGSREGHFILIRLRICHSTETRTILSCVYISLM